MYVSSRQKNASPLSLMSCHLRKAGEFRRLGRFMAERLQQDWSGLGFFSRVRVLHSRFFSPVWILRSEMLFQMKRCGEYAEGWGVCVEWLGFVAAGSCMDDTWDWIKSVIYKKPRPLNHIFGGDRILRAWHRGIKNAGPRKRAQGRAQDIPYQSVAPYHHGIWRIFIECSKKPHVRKSAQGRSARGPILPNPLLNARLDRIR